MNWSPTDPQQGPLICTLSCILMVITPASAAVMKDFLDLEIWSELMSFSRTACHFSCDILKETVCKMLTLIARSHSVGGHDIGPDHQLRRLTTIHLKMCYQSIFMKLYAPPLSSTQRSMQSILNVIICSSTWTFTLQLLAKFTQSDRPTGDSLDLPSFVHPANYI